MSEIIVAVYENGVLRYSQYQVLQINQALIEKAGELVIQYPLRAYDAVQLASFG